MNKNLTFVVFGSIFRYHSFSCRHSVYTELSVSSFTATQYMTALRACSSYGQHHWGITSFFRSVFYLLFLFGDMPNCVRSKPGFEANRLVPNW